VAADAYGDFRGADAAAGLPLQELFDDSIFEGMIADNDEPALIAEKLEGLL
jgi:hypothetical protein